MKPSALGQLNTVCEVCGDIGFKQLLLLCTDCRCSAAHRYCLDKVVLDASLTDWFCYECLQKRGEVTGIRSLEKVRTRDGRDEVFSRAAVETSGHFTDMASSCQHGATESSKSSKRFAKRQKGSSCHHGKTVIVATTSSSSEDSGDDTPSENGSLKSDDLQAPLVADYVLSRGSYLSEAQKDRVIARIQEIKPGITVFVAVMHKTHVKPPFASLAISVKYASAYFPHESTYVTLETPGTSKKWHPSYYKHKGARMLAGQWLDFVEDNYVQEGDICLLFPSKDRRKLSFTVQLLHATEAHSRGDNTPSKNGSLEPDDLQAPLVADYVLPLRSYLSEEQKDRVIAHIQEIKPGITVFVAIMHKTHVQPPNASMAISGKYASAHFPHESTIITLESPGKTKKWHPSYYRHKGGVCSLRGQWLDFVKDNQVQEGDICLLFPTKDGRKLSFTVHLLHATSVDSRGGTGFQSDGSCCGIHVPPESDAHGISTGSMEKDSGDPSKTPYILSFRNHLSQSEKKIVEDKVRAIQSKVPIYVAVMHKTNVTGACELEFSGRYAAANLPNTRRSVEINCTGRTWKAQMVVRDGRWFLCGGWSTFVRDNILRIGDICLIGSKMNGRELSMMVRIIFREDLY